MINLTNISKTFSDDLLKKPTKVLSDVSFQIKSNSITGFLGANGAGKTTCIKIMMGFITADSGRVDYINIDQKKIGFMPERPYYYKQLSGGDFLRFMAELNQIPYKEYVESRNYWLDRLSIAGATNKKLKDYSKGMLQRVGLAAALIHRPNLLILDEPLSGLDPVGRKDFKEIFIEIKKSGTSIFLSSHILPEMEEMCDQIVYLHQGKIKFEGPIENLLSNGKDEVRILAWGEVQKIRQISGFEKEIDEKRSFFVVKESSLVEKIEEIKKLGGLVKSVNPAKRTLEEIFYENEKVTQ